MMIQIIATIVLGLLILTVGGGAIEREKYGDGAGDYYTACAILILSIIMIWR